MMIGTLWVHRDTINGANFSLSTETAPSCGWAPVMYDVTRNRESVYGSAPSVWAAMDAVYDLAHRYDETGMPALSGANIRRGEAG